MAERIPVSNSVSIDGIPRIDVFLLHKRGALVDRTISRWQWPLPIGTVTIVARAESSRIFFSVNGATEVAHSIIRRAGSTGSTFPVFECSCGQPRRYLYVFQHRVACFSCHGRLSYPSAMPKQWNITQRRLARARAKLVQLEIEAASLRRSKRRVKRFEGTVP